MKSTGIRVGVEDGERICGKGASEEEGADRHAVYVVTRRKEQRAKARRALDRAVTVTFINK
jgi:hypothetical protein